MPLRCDLPGVRQQCRGFRTGSGKTCSTITLPGVDRTEHTMITAGRLVAIRGTGRLLPGIAHAPHLIAAGGSCRDWAAMVAGRRADNSCRLANAQADNCCDQQRDEE